MKSSNTILHIPGMRAAAAGLLLFLALAGGFAGSSRAGGKPLFEHAGFEAFAQGAPGDAGANLYVTRAGEVRTIHTWDYDRDGHADLLVNNDHNHVDNCDLLIHLNRAGRGFRSLMPPLPDMAPLQHTLRWIAAARESAVSLPSLGGRKVLVQDLNRDGHPDIALCNFVHGWGGRHFELFIYWGGAEGFSEKNRASLPTLTAHDLAAADLNGDGWTDLVLANNGYEYKVGDTPDEETTSYLYWGGPEGFSAERRMDLPTQRATAVVAADLNGDGHAEVVFANNESGGEQSLWLYEGGPQGPDAARRRRIETKRPTSLLAADLNGDGSPDLLVAHKNAEPAEIFFNDGAGGLKRQELPVKYVSDAAAADLDGDGRVDLALAVEISYVDGDAFTATAIPGLPGQDALILGERSSYHSASMILWGDPEGFGAKAITKLPTIGPSAVAVQDLDGDGRPELLFANRLDGQTFDVPSYIYWNHPDGYAPYHRTELQGFGPLDVAVVDADGDGRPDVLLANRLSGKTRAPLDSLLYWGNPRGIFSPSFMTRLPARTPLGSASADLNADGYPDIVFCNQGDDAYLYWGGAGGYSPTNRTTLPVRQSYSCEIADLNRDGHLDLTFAGRVQGTNVNAVIFWGAEAGYDPDRRRVIDADGPRSRGLSLADTDGDGHLDLLLGLGDTLCILKGGTSDFAWENRVDLPGLTARTAVPADLDGDGRLDLFVVNYQQGRRGEVPSYIYWNGPDGYDPARRTALPTLGAGSASIADLNGDGFLDIVTAHYNTGTRRSMPAYLYWGDADANYSVGRRSELPAESAFDVLIADLNRDGHKDIVVFNHTREHDHAFGTWIYYGADSGFSEARRGWVPSFGVHVHRGMNQGNLRTRRFEEFYVSAPLELNAADRRIALEWEAECPPESGLHFQVRLATNRAALADAPWRGPGGPGTTFDQPGAPGVAVPADNPVWLQYRARFRSADGSNYPVLRRVRGITVAAEATAP